MVAAEPAASAGQAWESFRARKRFGNLDGLRAFSILAVIWSHGPALQFGYSEYAGDLGVALFFAISGFLITTLLLRERERDGHISLPKFYARRGLRIFPLYYAVLGLYLLQAQWRETERGAELLGNLPYFLSYTANWFLSNQAVFNFAWSLATEEQFYLTWPWLLRFTPLRWAASLLALLLAARIGWSLMGATLDWSTVPMASLPARIFDRIQMSICWGCLLAIALHHRRSFQWLWALLGHRLSSLAAAAVALPVATQFGVADVSKHLFLTILLATCVLRDDTALAPLLQHRWAVFIGTISYGMYLLHLLVYNTLNVAGRSLYSPEWNAQTLQGFLPTLAITIVLAAFSYRYYEAPLLRRKPR